MEHVDRSTIWPYDSAGEPREFYYARYGHPTGAAAEARLGELERGDALLYASGMAAETTVLLALTRPGATIALAAGRDPGPPERPRERIRRGPAGPPGAHATPRPRPAAHVERAVHQQP